MKPEEIAAYIGAAAWLPTIIAWVARYIVRAQLRIIPDSIAEISHTGLGPIFNLRIAFAVENRDLIVDGLSLVLKHEDGDEQHFRWYGLGETISQTNDANGVKEFVSKDQSPIAIKVVVENLLEKHVRFQQPRYHETDNAAASRLLDQFNFLKHRSPDNFVPEVLQCIEFSAAVQHREGWFNWKRGRYDVTVTPKSHQTFDVTGARFSFALRADQIATLKENIPTLRKDVVSILSTNLPDYTPTPIVWKWVHVDLFQPSQ